jgi:acetyl esterase
MSVDPQLREAIASIAGAFPGWHALSVGSARRVEDELFSAGSGPAMEAVREVAIAGPGGDLPLRVYRPEGDGPLPTTVFYHGGGFVLGTLDSADDLCRSIAERTGSLVVSADYRRAPEEPFPAAVEDAVAALQWAGDHADGFGGDPESLSVAGTSAGGCLAAATALWARERGPALDCQALLYPMLDHALSGDSYREHGDRPLLSTADVRWFWEQYLRSPVDEHNPLAAPAMAGDLSGLPPAVVVTAGHDVLRDEGRAYADRLADAGVPVERHHYPAMTHGFLSLTDDVDAADDAMDAVAAAIQRNRRRVE